MNWTLQSLNMAVENNFYELFCFKLVACFDKFASFLMYHHMHGNFILHTQKSNL